jgi:hypothetical protein
LGLQPLCGIGVISLIKIKSKPLFANARIEASRPDPTPLT